MTASGAGDIEADVEPVGEGLVRVGGDQGEQEAFVVAHEIAAVGLEREPEAEVLFIERSTRLPRPARVGSDG